MTEEEQRKLLYRIFDLPPKTQKEADRNFVWWLLQVGCPVYYILAAMEELFCRDHPDDSYEENEEYDPED